MTIGDGATPTPSSRTCPTLFSVEYPRLLLAEHIASAEPGTDVDASATPTKYRWLPCYRSGFHVQLDGRLRLLAAEGWDAGRGTCQFPRGLLG